MRYIAVILLVGTVMLTGDVFDFGADASQGNRPQSADAIAALAKYEKVTKAAKIAYDKAVKDATAIAVKELEAARANAQKTGTPSGLEEANNITDTIKSIGNTTPAKGGGLKEKIIAARRLDYLWLGTRGGVLEFLPDGRIVGSGGPFEQRWRVQDEIIYISGSQGEEPFFPCSDGAFRGIWRKANGEGAILRFAAK